MMRLKSAVNEDAARTGASQENKEEIRVESPPETAATHERPLLHRRGVRLAGLLATLLALGIVVLPLTTGMSAWEWVRSGDARAAYGSENLRFVEATTLARLGLSARALDAAEGLTSPENRNDALEAIFPRLLSPWQPDLALRAVHIGETGQANADQARRRSDAIAASLRHHGVDDTVARLDRALTGATHEIAVNTLICQLAQSAPQDALRLIARMPVGEARDSLIATWLLPQLPGDEAIAQVSLLQSHARQMEFLSNLGANAADPNRTPIAERALERLRALAGPKDQAYIAASAQRLIGLYLSQNRTDRAQALVDRAGSERDILRAEMARHAAR